MSLADLRRRWFRPDLVAADRSAAEIQDALTCIRTTTWRSFRDRAKKLASECNWRPGMTNEQAASALIAKTVYGNILDEMDRIEQSTARKVLHATTEAARR